MKKTTPDYDVDAVNDGVWYMCCVCMLPPTANHGSNYWEHPMICQDKD